MTTQLNNPADFRLKKWYVDAADEQGQLFIGYWAEVRWKKLAVHLYQQLWHTPQRGIQTQTGLSHQPPPVWWANGRLCWEPAHTHASWESAADPLSETLLNNEQGGIQWHCYQPKACATIVMPELKVRGWGYTECLDLTIPAWRLPFKILYWGRCHSANHYFVWIDWDGKTTGRFLWHNGRLIQEWQIVDCLPHSATFQLEVMQTIPIRQGQLISTVFHSFRKFTRLFPRAAFLADEQKWFGRGQIETASGIEPATFIYEKVSW